MHFRQKLIFTALGSALTLAGYLLATIVSDVTAQDNKTVSLGDIVCDSLTVRDGVVSRFSTKRTESALSFNQTRYMSMTNQVRLAPQFLSMTT